MATFYDPRKHSHPTAPPSAEPAGTGSASSPASAPHGAHSHPHTHPAAPGGAAGDHSLRYDYGEAPENYVCSCMRLTREALLSVIRASHCRSVREIVTITRATRCCGLCRGKIASILRQARSVHRTPVPPDRRHDSPTAPGDSLSIQGFGAD